VVSVSDAGPGDVTTIEESVGEFQERKFLEQVYESYEGARRAVSEWEATQGTDPDARRIAIVALSDVVRLVEPLLRESDFWTEPLGRVEMVRDGELQPVRIDGLQGFLTYRDGYPTVVERESAASNNNTYQEQTTAPLPGRIITAALRALTQFLHEKGILSLNGAEPAKNPSSF
jgi:hypothetical protein